MLLFHKKVEVKVEPQRTEIPVPDDTLPLRTRAEIALAMLPDKADDIARLLVDLGIKGTSEAIDCPLANYFKAATGSEKLAVAHTGIYFGIDTTHGEYDAVDLPTPQALCDFMNMNDVPSLCLGSKKLFKQLKA